MTSLTRSALVGVIWNYLGSAVLVVTQIASTAATARLIVPAGFGAYASAQAAAAFAGYFTLSTIGLALQRRSVLSAEAIGTATVLSVGAGTLVFTAMWLSAGLWAEAWGIHAAAPLVRILGAALFLTSLSSVPLALLRYRLRFAAAAVAETGAQVIGITLGVLLAVHSHSATALATGQLVAAATLLFATTVLARRELRFRFSRSESRALLTFGSQLSFIYFGSYIAITTPSWIAGRKFGAFTLGLYSRAYLMAGIPFTYLSTSVTKVLFPLYSRVQDDIARTRAFFSDGIVLATGVTWPLFAVLAGGASVAVDVLLGSRWHGATPLLQLSVLIACGAFPTTLLTTAAEALGWMRLAAGRLVLFLALLAVAVGAMELFSLDLRGLLVGVALAQWATYGLTLVPFLNRGVVDVRLVARSHLIHGSVSIAAFFAALLCAHSLGSANLLIRVAAEFAIAFAVCALALVGRSWFPASQVLGRRLANARLST